MDPMGIGFYNIMLPTCLHSAKFTIQISQMQVNVSYKDPRRKDGISVNLRKTHIRSGGWKPSLFSDHTLYRDVHGTYQLDYNPHMSRL